MRDWTPKSGHYKWTDLLTYLITGSTSRTGPEDLLRIVTWNSQSIAASRMRSTSAPPSKTMSAVRLCCQDPERERSPDDEHHEGLLAEHLRHVQDGQRTFYTKIKKVLDAINVADVSQVPLKTAPWIQQRPTTKSAQAYLKPILRQIADLLTSHWQTAWENEDTGAVYRHLQPHISYKIKYRIQPHAPHVEHLRQQNTSCCLSGPPTAARRTAPCLHPDLQTVQHQDHPHNNILHRHHLRLARVIQATSINDVLQHRGLYDLHLHRQEVVIKHQIRSGCANSDPAAELL